CDETLPADEENPGIHRTSKREHYKGNTCLHGCESDDFCKRVSSCTVLNAGHGRSWAVIKEAQGSISTNDVCRGRSIVNNSHQIRQRRLRCLVHGRGDYSDSRSHRASPLFGALVPDGGSSSVQ